MPCREGRAVADRSCGCMACKARPSLASTCTRAIGLFPAKRLQTGASFPSRHVGPKSSSPAALKSSVHDFLEGKWAPVSRRFIYATSASARSTNLASEIKTLASRLIEESIEFVVWDKEAISTRLKEYPRLVDDFFGREWVTDASAVTLQHTASTHD